MLRLDGMGSVPHPSSTGDEPNTVLGTPVVVLSSEIWTIETIHV
ncbi:hypothetical protein HanXRQr2_Chr01g0019391 [Helianthus annuus]|uniref:Uncharacterized protein n=1 Tax=Helianthus annuus TaxID=4232 RepID=A0A9K3P2P0_HELAN|nr:hypothetical protein HanXRQr2_Chr01g0019391 [Helianthus annuus]KAJ0956718.1 hypothetical protein HanPSC8_Chr01g0018821 [Helianthus annuus]